MRKLNKGFKAILGTALLVSVASVSFYTGKHSVEIPEVESLPDNVVYQDSDMRIEVIDVEDGLKDVYIEPLKDNNVVTNFDMDTRTNEIDAYLSVRSKENALKTYKMVKSQFPEMVTWDFNWSSK